jgi:hypothetical protein
MAKAVSPVPTVSLQAYERLVTTNPHVERKGATMPYTSHNLTVAEYRANIHSTRPLIVGGRSS